MGRSIGTPERKVPAGQVTESASGGVIRIDWANGRMVHHLAELGFRANYTIDYQIGAGKVGYSYISQIGEYLLQSPASYYRAFGWDVSPGFKDSALLDFDRVLSGACLSCHSNNPVFVSKRQLAKDAKVEAISCGRCHGDTRAHVDHPSKTNVVNPARLAVRARDSVCEQCHLEGVARILNPGKNWRDFQAGKELETTFSVYVDDQRGPAGKVVSQVEQLALSRCARESAGKLWCGTCHDPHGANTVNRTSEVRAICTSCHEKLSPASHPAKALDCVSCHMPRLRPNDVAHAASTDHRLLRTSATGAVDSLPVSIRAWHEPDIEIRQRSLGLAELEASASPSLQSLGDAGAKLLEELPAGERESDAAVLAALGDFRRALQLAPANGEYAMYLGIALKRQGDLPGAAQALQNAIAIDASLQQAYLELSALYVKQGKVREAADVLNEYLGWNPQSILVRSSLDGLR